MSVSESDLLGLIGLVYEAAENPGLWSEFLQNYAGLFAADLAFVQRHRLVQRTAETSSADLVKSEFYSDYVVPMGAAHCSSGVVAREQNHSVTLAVMRARQRPPFGEAERRALQVLLPHVTRAHAMGTRLQILDASESVLDALDVALVFMTSAAELIHCSGAAETIISSGDGLSVANGRLHAIEPRVDAQLREAVRAATCVRQGVESPGIVTVARPSDKRPYRLLIGPLRQGLPSFAGMRQPEVVLLILDPENQRPAATDILKRVFGLTPREAALGSALSTGKPVDEAADELGMAYETARGHLRRIFDKTQTSRQTELMMVLARLPKD